jgi:hypothetical protein
MKELLVDCCEKTIILLDNLLREKGITQEEYDTHIKMKLDFISKINQF